MELNESLVKVDMSLDSNVKKVEKQAKELQAPELMIELSNGKSKENEKSYQYRDCC